MQLRVIAALRDARDGAVAETSHERLTLSMADKELARDEANEWRLIESPGRMRIETVDAFGAGIARSLPLSSGLGGAGNTIADAAMATIYQQAAAATLDYLTGNDAPAEAVAQVMRHLDNNAGLYVSYLSRMLSSREQWLGITGSGISDAASAAAARAKLERNIADVIDRQLQQLNALLPPICLDGLPPLLVYAGSNLRDEGKTEHKLVPFSGLSELPQAISANRDQWHGIADLLLTQKGEWRKQVTKNDGFPAGNKEIKQSLYDIIDAIRDMHDLRDSLQRTKSLPDPCYSDDQWAVLLALFELLPLAVGELRRLFGERGVTDHNEVALSAGRALGDIDEPGDVALMLDYRVQHLLVDEMQDTSIGQYDLLKKLTAGWVPGDGRTIFCVGDPMQSIYRFRDAEVGEFLLAKKKGIGSTRLNSLTLRRNFRSGENLVHWFNTVFNSVMPLKDDVAVGAISYSESAPISEKSGEGVYEVHPLFDVDPEREAQYSLQIIARCLEENGDKDVAVLVRSRTQLSRLLPMLRRAGIEYRAVEIDRLTDLPEIIDLIALTRALCHDDDRLAWLSLLRGPWAGLRWADIHLIARNDSKSTVRELCADPERIAALSDDGRQRLQDFMERLSPWLARNATQSLREIVELAWCALGGPALLDDTEQLANVYRYLDTLDRIGIAGTIDDVRELEQRLDDERVSSIVSADCRLHVMTMHKAKGLQFDHVVLHGLGRITRGISQEVLSWLTVPDEEGQSEMIISPVGPRTELDNDPLHQFIEATEKEKTRLELDRLLYVACTRAKKSLHLIGNTGIARDGESCKRPDARSLLSRLWPALEREYNKAFDQWAVRNPERAEHVDDDEPVFVLPSLRRFAGPWQPPVPAAVPGHGPDREVSSSPEDKPVEFDWVGAATRHTGTIVHRWLQRIGDGRLDISIENLADLNPVSRRWAVSLGVSEDNLDDVCRQAEKALEGILSDEKGRWVLYGEGACELAVSGMLDGRWESVIMDRVRIDDAGVHWIVDYKTSIHLGGDLPGFLQQESDRYRPQLARYAAIYEALTGEKARTALYFPLLQEFREVATTPL
jgi:ATP-dependent exoDNAse (exonuclease V) beta subunit